MDVSQKDLKNLKKGGGERIGVRQEKRVVLRCTSINTTHSSCNSGHLVCMLLLFFSPVWLLFKSIYQHLHLLLWLFPAIFFGHARTVYFYARM